MHPFVKTTASVALAALLVAAGPALAIGRAEAQSRAPGRAELGRVQIPYERFTLPNGLTVLVYTDRTAPSVFVGVWYRIGSKDEPEGRTGFAQIKRHTDLGLYDRFADACSEGGGGDLACEQAGLTIFETAGKVVCAIILVATITTAPEDGRDDRTGDAADPRKGNEG